MNHNWCNWCNTSVAKKAKFCPTCGDPWHRPMRHRPLFQHRPGMDKPGPGRHGRPEGHLRRETGAPRNRDKGKEKGKDKGKQSKGASQGTKNAKGEQEALFGPWTPPALPVAPSTSNAPATPAVEDNRLAQQLREAFQSTETAIPTAVAEILAKAEGESAELLTKNLHVHSSALGTARKQVHQARAAIAAQNHGWAVFVQSALDAIAKISIEHEANLEKLKQMEQEGLDKARMARASTRQLNSSVTELDADDSGDAELVADAENMDLTEADDLESSAQVQKKLRMTLEELARRMPTEDQATPKRRVKQELPQGPSAPALSSVLSANSG